MADNKYFYLYNPIPIVKQEAAYVIQNILKSKKSRFNIVNIVI